MSEYRKIDCVGWWEQEYTEVRLEVVAVAKEVVFYFEHNFHGKETPRNMPLQCLPQAKHLPDCTGWDWQPEEWEDIDPTKITLAMFPLEARFHDKLTEDWKYSKLYGYWVNTKRYQCDTTWWKYCQVKKGVQK